MYACVSVVIILIILVCYLRKYIENKDVKDEHYSYKQLRGMYINEIVDKHYNHIYTNIIDMKTYGYVASYFTLMCVQLQDGQQCDNYDGSKEWLMRHYGDPVAETIKLRLLKKEILRRVKRIFPDSNITRGYKNCCEQYKITWSKVTRPKVHDQK